MTGGGRREGRHEDRVALLAWWVGGRRSQSTRNKRQVGAVRGWRVRCAVSVVGGRRAREFPDSI